MSNTNGTGAPTGSCSAGVIYTNNSTGQIYACNSGSWLLISAGGGVTATAGQTLYASATNAASGGTVVLDMAGISGADLGAKMNTCATTLPAGGGTCKGDNLSGAQTLSTAVTTAKAVVYTFCGQSVSQSAAVTLANANSAVVGCPGGNTTFTKAGNIDQFTLSVANTVVSWLTLVGVSGSFTGNGIVLSASSISAQALNNNVTGEASQAIKSSGIATIAYNTVTTAIAAQPAITSQGSVIFNTCTTTNTGDCIDLSGNYTTAMGNVITIQPSGATSGACGINATGDMIGVRVLLNQVTINDSHNLDVNYGICDTPTSGHNMNMFFEADHVNGILSGGATGYGFFLNNVNNVNVNWSVTVRNIGCVHLTFCVKRTDTQNNPTQYVDIQPGDIGIDAGTGSTQDIWINLNSKLTAATLPSPAGDGSMLFSSNGLGTGAPVPCMLVHAGGNWQCTKQPSFSFVTGSNAAKQVSASNTTQAYGVNLIPGGLAVFGVSCSAASAPTFSVSDNLNGNYTSATAVQANPGGNEFAQLWYFAGVAGGTTTVTVSSGGTCTLINLAEVEYINLLQLTPLDGAGASANGTGTALASGSFSFLQGDLVVGLGSCTATGISAGAGFTSRASAASHIMLEDLNTVSTGTSNALFTCATGGWEAQGIAFKLAP